MKPTLYLSCVLFAVSLSAAEQPVAGKWLTDLQGNTLKDPQSSGFTWRHNEIIHLGDNSAAPEMRNKLLRVNPQSAQLNAPPLQI
ncbi:MAG TPA: hypothetical protein VFY01_01960, partial [Rheinheimera sp.]|nr:hypothetical protein [Rheinheimera sp.]